MRIFLLHILFILLIGESTGCVQFFKLPKLYEHYREHVRLNPGVSVTDFLAMHYWGQDIDDHDDEKDMELPFRKYDYHAPIFVFVPNFKVIALKPSVANISREFNPAPTPFYFNPAGESLFRPPKA